MKKVMNTQEKLKEYNGKIKKLRIKVRSLWIEDHQKEISAATRKFTIERKCYSEPIHFHCSGCSNYIAKFNWQTGSTHVSCAIGNNMGNCQMMRKDCIMSISLLFKESSIIGMECDPDLKYICKKGNDIHILVGGKRHGYIPDSNFFEGGVAINPYAIIIGSNLYLETITGAIVTEYINAGDNTVIVLKNTSSRLLETMSNVNYKEMVK
jgi:hypothetical protein